MDDQTRGSENTRDGRITALEQKIATLERKIPPSGIFSRNFLKRSFVIWGHYFVANFIIGMGVAFCMLMFVMFLLFMGAPIFD